VQEHQEEAATGEVVAPVVAVVSAMFMPTVPSRVEDRIRCGKDTGLGRFPSRVFALNAAWLELALTAIDLLAWTQDLLLDGDLATCEPKALRYRLLHTAARITRGQRRIYVRLAEHWHWARDLAAAFARLALIPHPLRT
jgi:hypothetical protein